MQILCLRPNLHVEQEWRIIMEKNLTQGSVKKHYFKYLCAAFGSSMISCIYGLVDSAVVGQYQGPQGTAALSIVMPRSEERRVGKECL